MGLARYTAWPLLTGLYQAAVKPTTISLPQDADSTIASFRHGTSPREAISALPIPESYGTA
jgi:hypothetical protein